MKKCLFISLFYLMGSCLYAENPLLNEADKLLDKEIEYYLVKSHDLHVAQVKVSRAKGIDLYQLKKMGSERDKLNYLFAHHQKILTSLQELKESNFKTIQSKLVKEKVQLIKKSLQTKGI